jgi:hypothetical protein
MIKFYIPKNINSLIVGTTTDVIFLCVCVPIVALPARGHYCDLEYKVFGVITDTYYKYIYVNSTITLSISIRVALNIVGLHFIFINSHKQLCNGYKATRF